MNLSKPISAALLAILPLIGGLALSFVGPAAFLLIPIATAIAAHLTSVQAVPVTPFSRAAAFAALWSTVAAALIAVAWFTVISPSADEGMMIFLVLPIYWALGLAGALFGFALRWAWFRSAT